MPKKQTDKLYVDDEKYAGRFVATPSFSNHTIISSGLTMSATLANAKEKGYAEPVIVKIPKKGAKLIFLNAG